MAEKVTINELDWSALDGKTMTITVQVMGDQVYVVSGHQVHVVNLGAGKITEELPFFGPRSTRAGRLTDEQQHAMDLLIKEGYTTHRAAMLLGVHDSTVQSRKKQLRSGAPKPRPALTDRSGSVTNPLSVGEIETIRQLWFEQSKTKAYIAGVLQRAESTVNRYIHDLEEGKYGGHPLALANTSDRIIDHEAESLALPNGTH